MKKLNTLKEQTAELNMSIQEKMSFSVFSYGQAVHYTAMYAVCAEKMYRHFYCYYCSVLSAMSTVQW